MIEFLKLREVHIEMVMNWRVKPEVTRYMLTDIDSNLEIQRQWFKRISKDETCRYWVVCFQSIPIGVINLAAIDRINLRCSAGYYIGEDEYRQLGTMIPPYLYNYVFREMKLRKIYGEVVAGNENVLKIHRMHGFREVGILKEHIIKKNQLLDVIIVELLSEIWLNKKRYHRYIANMEI